MNMRHETKERFSVADKVLTVLSKIYELNERAARGLVDPLTYEKHMYWERIREENEERKQERRRVKQTLSVLEQAGHIVHSGKAYRLTPSGWLKFAISYSRAMKRLKKKKRANTRGKRKMIVVFDIPERERSSRNVLRNLLYALGFSMFQRSVFIGSDPKSFEVVSKVVVNAGIADKVKLLVVDQVL